MDEKERRGGNEGKTEGVRGNVQVGKGGERGRAEEEWVRGV